MVNVLCVCSSISISLRFDGLGDHRGEHTKCSHPCFFQFYDAQIFPHSDTCYKILFLFNFSNVNQIPINFNLESGKKLLNISKTSKGTESPQCLEHQLALSHRCSTHKAWVCQSCVREDHSSESCHIITVTEELNDKKSRQLEQSKVMLYSFEETCKKLDDCKKQYTEQMTECDKYNVRLNKEIQRKKTSKLQFEENFAFLDQKIDNLKVKRFYYNEAVSSLKESETVKEVSQCSSKLQNEAEKLKLISLEIEKELESTRRTVQFQHDDLLGFPKLSVKDGRTHLHVLQVNDIYKSSPGKLQYPAESVPPLTDGIFTFLDMGWPGKEPRRVYSKMVGNT
ncbi:unnamed protein product, partial [Meganyctiphanes norvegica]